MASQTLSIIIPIHNEQNTIEQVISQVESVTVAGISKELILIDDCSTDNTATILAKFEKQYKIVTNPTNLGKSASIKKGILLSTGDLVIIQDADLEYNPQDYPNLLAGFNQNPHIDVIYGSRFKENQNIQYNQYWLANRLLTILSNLCTGQKLTDMETCYKLFPGDLIREIAPSLNAPRFGFEAEITAKLAKKKKQIQEVPIAYSPRSTKEGKHIGVQDGIQAIKDIIKYNLFE